MKIKNEIKKTERQTEQIRQIKKELINEIEKSKKEGSDQV